MLKFVLHLRAAVVWVLESAVITTVALLVLDVLWGVFTRFALNAPSRWTEEVATILLIWVALLGAAVAFGRQEHLGVDYFVKKLNPDVQLLIALTGQLIVMGFTAAAFLGGGYVLVARTLASGQVTPAMGFRMGYVYLAVPVSGLFIVLFCLERTVEICLKRKANKDDPAGTEAS